MHLRASCWCTEGKGDAGTGHFILAKCRLFVSPCPKVFACMRLGSSVSRPCVCAFQTGEISRGFHGNLVERGDAALGSAEPADRTPRTRGRAKSCEERGSLRKRRHALGSSSCGHGKGARPVDACCCMTAGSNQQSRSFGFWGYPAAGPSRAVRDAAHALRLCGNKT